jgi:hypothetical protein
MSTPSYPRFISTSTYGKDLFQSGSQNKTAKSIVEHIRMHSADFKLVGLDGNWGSGKSNVIHIIQNQLGESYHLFIYDAWSHQEDLQRRSFLEELTEELSGSKVLTQKWDKKLKDLLAKKQEKVFKTIPRLNTAIIFSVVVAILLPFANALSEVVKPQGWKLVIASFPLIAAIIVWVIASIKKKKALGVELLYLYTEKSLEEVTTETISESEPSVREFRNWMNELSNDLSKNLVIVFDNMDRLPVEKVQSMWTLIHTFFSVTTYKKISAIVPFDRKHIREAFKEKNDSDFEKTNHFINKTFSVIFNVSPPVLTDWKAFFTTKYLEAFGETEATEYLYVRNIFDLYTSVITPRKIIAFINDLVTQKLVWKSDISLRYMAVFVLKKEQILSDPIPCILNQTEILRKVDSLFRDDEKFSDNLAALIYNVPVEKASQVSLYREVEIAIREKRSNELIQLSEHPDFYSILEQIPTEEIDVEAFVLTLNEFQKEHSEDKEPALMQIIWDKILAKQLSTPLDDLAFTLVFKVLFKKASSSKHHRFAQYLLNKFTIARNFTGSKYYDVLTEMESFIKENNIDVNIFSLIRPMTANSAEYFMELVEKAKETYSKYKISCPNNALEQYFIDKVPDTLQKGYLLKFVTDEYKFPTLKKQIAAKINAGETSVTNILPMLQLYQAIVEEMPIKIHLTDQVIYSYLNTSEKGSSTYYEMVAMRVARGEQFVSQGSIDQPILQLVEEELVSEVASRIEYYENYGSLLLQATVSKTPLVCAVAKQMTVNGNGSRMNIEVVLPHYFIIQETLSLDDETLLSQFDRWTPFLKEHLTGSSLEQVIPNPDFFDSATTVENDLTQFIFEVAAKYVAESDEEKWKKAFSLEKTYLFRVFVALLRYEKIIGLPEEAISAYKQVLKEILAGTRKVPADIDDWNLIFKKSDKIHLKVTVKDIRDSFLTESKISAKQFLFFEPLFRELGDLEERAGDVVRRILTPIVKDESCLNKILTERIFYTELIKKSNEISFDLIEEIRKAFEVKQDNQEIFNFNKIVDNYFADKVKVEWANYFSPELEDQKKWDVTTTIKQIVENDKTLHFKVGNLLTDGKDPHPNVVKKLEIQFNYNGESKYKIVNEHEWISLP